MAARTLPAYPCQLVKDKDAPLGDPNAEWWTTEDVAAYLGVKPATVRRYRMADRGDGALPEEEAMFVRSPAWRPATIIAWHKGQRPGQGTGGGRKPKSPPPADPKGQ